MNSGEDFSQDLDSVLRGEGELLGTSTTLNVNHHFENCVSGFSGLLVFRVQV